MECNGVGGPLSKQLSYITLAKHHSIDENCATYKEQLGDTKAWQVLHINDEGRPAQSSSTEHQMDYCHSRLNWGLPVLEQRPPRPEQD